METLGIDIGASSVKATYLADGVVVWDASVAHDGDIPQTLSAILDEHGVEPGIPTLVTGGEGRKATTLRDVVLPIAIEHAMAREGLAPRAVVSVGGEELTVYSVSDGRIVTTLTGDKCASGTGEFFKQQLGRMNLGLDHVAHVGDDAVVHKLSSRCSVFMKSDCTHKLNKKEATKDDIVVSLSMVMAKKVKEYLTRARIADGEVILIGGAIRNQHIVRLVGELLPDVDFVIPDGFALFESRGAAALAQVEGLPLPTRDALFPPASTTFERLDALSEAEELVTFIPSEWGTVKAGGEYLMGVDGGSTTTKIALVDAETHQIVAAHYGRTHGDPVEACRVCLHEIKRQVRDVIGDAPITISQVATTGSSREILGVFLQTPGVFNEIIAHTVGVTHFDESIDTIFEIGGQDAKYVYLKNNVPIDYAMNEACSAGTGSFLEESASGDLNIARAEDIGPIALRSTSPLKFGEHCSAFINSDIRKAIQEGSSRPDIVAGIVYSVTANYLNRVLGNRAIGSTIVLQGGVAKNPAVPMAFASLLKKPIVVPPDPELMGSFGVALLAQQKAQAGLLAEGSFDMDTMLAATITYGKEFRCKACENDCPIRTLVVDGTKYFFGGRCSKYTLMRKNQTIDPAKSVDYVAERTRMLFEEFCAPRRPTNGKVRPKVAVPLAFTVHDFWPLFSWYFHKLDMDPVLVDDITEEGVQRSEAAFCFPGEIAHGALYAMVQGDFDYYFLPHMKLLETYESDVHATLCPIVQGLPYYAKQAFPELDEGKILSPIVDFGDGWDKGRKPLVELALTLGKSEAQAREAIEAAMLQQKAYWMAAKELGRHAIAEAEADGRTVILVQGRPYNAYYEGANMGIPRKFSSRGYTVLPMDFLPIDPDAPISPNMYWYYGQLNLKATVFAKKHPNIFACYISNFSCAPDSFILHQTRWFMGTKPFLVLELDSHSADAGIDTRVEAFLDIIEGYKQKLSEIHDRPFERRYTVVFDGPDTHVLDRKTGDQLPLSHDRVTMLVPSMGHFASETLSAALQANNIDAVNLPVADIRTTQLARNVASGKECLPTLLVLGTTLQFFMREKTDPSRVYVVVVPKTTGPCRTGQYAPFFDRVFDEIGLENVALADVSSDNSYTELGQGVSKMLWGGFMISDVIKDADTALRIVACDKDRALETLGAVKRSILTAGRERGLEAMLTAAEEGAKVLGTIPTRGHVEGLKKVLVVGEIFVRRDDFSQSQLVDMLAEKGIMPKLANLTEWVHYTDFIRKHTLEYTLGKMPLYKKYFSREFWDLQLLHVEELWKAGVDKRVYDAFRPTGLIPKTPHDMRRIMRHVGTFSDTHLESEATISSCVAAEAMEQGYHGIIAIAPFACLIGRLIRSFMGPYMRERGFPFMAIENDGQKYPLNVVNELEMFMLNVQRFEGVRPSAAPYQASSGRRVAASPRD